MTGSLRNRISSCGWMLLFLLIGGSTGQCEEQIDVTFERQVRPLLTRYCAGCHGADEQLADVRLDTLSPDFSGRDSETWHDVLGKLNRGEMPPEEEPQPTEAERAVLTDWLTAGFKRHAAEKRSTGGRVVMRRLTRDEYRNTLRDLLGVDLDFARDLPPDSVSPDGFRNNGSTLSLSPLQIELYLKAAREGLARTIVTGPEPDVVQKTIDTSGQYPGRKKGAISNRLQGNNRFLMKLDEFPREGRFRVRVRARAEIPEGAAVPRLRVNIGVRADVKSPQRTVDVVDVENTGEAIEYEFTGRIEEFPLPGHNPKYPGLLVTALSEDGGAGSNQKPKKNKKNVEDPTRPVIVIESLEFEGPLFDAWPPKPHREILFESDNRTDEIAYATEVVSRFAERAFRRPLVEGEVTDYVDFFREIRPAMPSFEDAMRETLAMVLISPQFLYLVEPVAVDAEGGSEPRPLTDHELAARLSYFLWGTMPDRSLRELADRDELADRSQLEQTARTMLADERSGEFIRHFVDGWLDLPAVDRVAVNPEYFPGFDDALKADMQEETRRFFEVVLRENLSAMTLIDSDFTVLNRRLAEHYGIDADLGSRFERVPLSPGDRRGGLLGHGSVHLLNSTGEQSHPIRRAVWVRTRLLDDPPAPPPPDVPDLDESNPEVAKLSLRAQLEHHRTKAACNACHRGIDPWGITLENFDAVGRWRTKYEPHLPVKKRRGKRFDPVLVDSVATLPGGAEVAGVPGLKAHLLTTDRDRVARAMVRKLLTYALGRSLESTDDSAVEKLTADFAANDYRLADLVVAITLSEPFRMK